MLVFLKKKKKVPGMIKVLQCFYIRHFGRDSTKF